MATVATFTAELSQVAGGGLDCLAWHDPRNACVTEGEDILLIYEATLGVIGQKVIEGRKVKVAGAVKAFDLLVQKFPRLAGP